MSATGPLASRWEALVPCGMEPITPFWWFIPKEGDLMEKGLCLVGAYSLTAHRLGDAAAGGHV